MDKIKNPKFWMTVALILCLISSIFASAIQSSFGDVRVEDLRIVVDKGYVINAQIFIPDKASEENPLPLVVVSHGSFNNFDHQDINMIELSRRGFVVISSDAYRHGSSSVYVEPADTFMNMVHLIDYATASYKFIDKEKIGISGHSMGAMITNVTAQYYFQQEAQGTGENKIAAVLDVGYDPQYTPYEFEGVAEPVNPAVNWGVIAAKYDEWFFKGETGNPALYLKSDAARSFINQLEGVNLTGDVENGKIYTGTIDGEEFIRAIYQNHEIHPLNHFSKRSAASQVDFFYNALGVPNGYEMLDPGDQTWLMKEIFNFVGLIGIFIFIVSFAFVLIDSVPYFGVLKAAAPVPCAPALDTGKKKLVFWGTYAVNMVIPALLVMPIMFKLLGKSGFVPNAYNAVFGEPNTNELALWTLVVAVVILGVFLLSNKLFGDKAAKGIPECWGVKASFVEVFRGFLLALITIGTAYVILFASDLIFNVDYRIWVLDMRVFSVNKLPLAVVYFPAFLAFYLVNSMLVNGGNRVEGMPDWLVTVISCISNIAGIAVLIAIQYIGIAGSGTFPFNSMRIVNLFPLLTLIPVATIVTRMFFKKTGKIYTGSFAIAMLYTMMTVANTMILGTILG